MVQENMVKVAIWFDAPAEYSGGINYIKNVLYALSLVNDGSIHPYIFFSSDISEHIESQFSPFATVISSKLLQRGTSLWFIHKILYKFFGSMILVTALLRSHGITILSHVWFVYRGRTPFRIIGWIPDFQYLHLPELFPSLDINEETKENLKIISQSDLVILSSYNALEDFKSITQLKYQSRAKVLQFVSQPRNSMLSKTKTREAMEIKYDFQGKFLFLPNQFWAHKNHFVVLKAVKLLKDSGLNILILCTGNLQDLRVRNTTYIDAINEYIKVNNLQNHVKILGHINYDDVLQLMKNSLAVINPSYFEGWSSSVEEAKSMGKPVILSRIDVHIEQKPQNGQYFEPDDVTGLSKIFSDVWLTPAHTSQKEVEQKAQQLLQKRTIDFGKAYFDILNDVNQKA